jgi:hypothetical protein
MTDSSATGSTRTSPDQSGPVFVRPFLTRASGSFVSCRTSICKCNVGCADLSSANGFKNFFPSVIETLGFNQIITLVLTCPPYLIAGIFSITVSLTSGKYNERTWHITACKAVAIVGFALAPATLNVGVRYFAMCVFTIGTYGVNSIILGWAATVCSQSLEKKAVVIAMMTSISNASFIYTPYLFRNDDRPRYTIAMSAMAGFSLLCALCAWGMRFVLIKQNRTLAATGAPTKYPY